MRGQTPHPGTLGAPALHDTVSRVVWVMVKELGSNRQMTMSEEGVKDTWKRTVRCSCVTLAKGVFNQAHVVEVVHEAGSTLIG